MNVQSQGQTSEETRLALEHRQIVLDIQTILASKSGKSFIKYLFESFEVGILPERGLPQDILMDYLGFLRAGNQIFKIVAEANPEIAGTLLGQIEKERHAQAISDLIR